MLKTCTGAPLKTKENLLAIVLAFYVMTDGQNRYFVSDSKL